MRRILLAVIALLALTVPALAQEWVVSRVRGTAEIQIGWSWVPLERGRQIQPRQKLRTGADGRIGLMRGNETIELEGNTEISLRDAGSELKTSVIQTYGAVSVDVERRNVQHFSVQTPYLAAVVKGTKFTVVVDGSSARVNVDRGVVQVQDTGNDLVTDIRPGQQAVVSETEPLNVTGGQAAAAVFTFQGVQVVPGTTQPVADTSGEPTAPGGPGAANSNAANPGNGNGPGNGGGNGPGNSGGNGGSAGGGNSPGNSGGHGQGHAKGGGNGNGHGSSGDNLGNSGGNGPGNGGGNGPGNSGGNGGGAGGGNGPGNSGGNGDPGPGHGGNGVGNSGGNGGGPGHGDNGPGNSGGKGHGQGGNGPGPGPSGDTPGNSGGNGGGAGGGGNGPGPSGDHDHDHGKGGGGPGPSGDGGGSSGGKSSGPGNSGGGNGGNGGSGNAGGGNGNGRG